MIDISTNYLGLELRLGFFKGLASRDATLGANPLGRAYASRLAESCGLASQPPRLWRLDDLHAPRSPYFAATNDIHT